MIAIVYPYLAHYRYPIFCELCNSKDYKFRIISGVETDVNLKTLDPKYAHIPIEEGGLTWEFVKNVWLLNKRLLWQNGLISKCLKNDFDAYIFFGNAKFITTWICASILRIKGKKIYFWTHGVRKKERGIKSFFRVLFYKLAHGLFLYGNYAAQIIEEKGFSKNNLHVIYNSLDYRNQLKLRNLLSKDSLENIRSKFFEDPLLPQIIFIGRIIKEKKIDQLIEAVKILRDEHFMVNILLVGEGEEEKMLKELVTNYKLDKNVLFYGPSYNEGDNYNLIAGSDVCISPGGVGLNAIHSLTYGTPVITHNIFCKQGPEFEAIEPGVTGDFFEIDNTYELSRTIKNWFIKNNDREKIRFKCYKIIDERYNPFYQYKIICEVLKNDKIPKSL
jgi:glycosyltransferase involved in cell wall biosynthesis